MSDTKDKKTPHPKKKPAGKSEIVDTMVEMAVIPFFVDADDGEERSEASTPTIQEMASEEDAALFEDDDDDTVRMDVAIDSLGPDSDD